METIKSQNPLNIVVAGASGYIGRALLPKLREQFPNSTIYALSRTARVSEDPGIRWLACDLFSLRELENVLPEKIDCVYYLVHSMHATAHLDQGDFSDYDLILADNFARILKRQNQPHIIYLGGLIPQSGKLSKHLESRLEVEKVFRRHNLKPTVMRAGLIIGQHGSSFEIMTKLIGRLPVMICPLWTQTLTTPVGLTQVIATLVDALSRPETMGQSYDLAGTEPMTYIKMMNETAKWLGVKRFFIPVRYFSATLSRLWVSLITRKPKELVYPLIHSLKLPMMPREGHLYPGIQFDSYSNLLQKQFTTKTEKSQLSYSPRRLRVRSVQRLILPIGFTAESVRQEYFNWLPKFFSPFLEVWLDGEGVVFSLFRRQYKILVLHLSRERSTPDRQLMYIKGGILAGEDKKARLEFREVLDGKYVLAAIHDYRPALPWYIYVNSQALVHLFTMRMFNRHLKTLAANPIVTGP